MTIKLADGWVDGKPITSGKRFVVLNPASQKPIAEVADLNAAHAKQAINAARDAFTVWRNCDVSTRISTVLAWAALIESNVDNLAKTVCAEGGKPIQQAHSEIMQCSALLRWFAKQAEQTFASQMPDVGDAQQNVVVRQPIGVVACITPWNFPAAAVIVKAGAAIVAGNTVIVKPSDETPLVALAIARLGERAELPPGVFNVLPCKNPAGVGDALCASRHVRMLSFTGSTATGRHLYRACGGTIKRIALELGGNAPFILFDDADMDAAVDGAMGARFYNSGQICVGANRYLVQRSVYDEFAGRLTERVANLKVGTGIDEDNDIGPLINRAAVDRLQFLIDDAKTGGATVKTGGKQIDDASLLFMPTVLTGMRPAMAAYSTEIFGPVACLYNFDDEDDALTMANDTEAGLSAYVYTSDHKRLARCIDALEAGVVGANSTNIFSNDFPFGGIKQSGIGREHGYECLDEYTEIKSVSLGPA